MDDPELKAMHAVAQELERLDAPARERVVRWALDRYVLTRTPAAVSDNAERPGRGGRPGSDIDGLYAATRPSTDAEKLLVAGYWFQVVRGDRELDSQSLNKALKNLGYPVGNVARAVSTLAGLTPRLVVQIRKTGSTAQARKRFRLTVEGVRRVEDMRRSAHSTR